MWKRFQGHGREKERQIGHPVLVQTTYDQDLLRHNPNIMHTQNASYQPIAVPSPEDYDSQAPQYSQHTQYPTDNRISEIPTVSSIYSQPSPDFGYDYNAASQMRYSVDISPPSSPELRKQHHNPDVPRRFHSMRDVSPIDESRGETTPSPQAGSNIPVLRKAALGIRGEEKQSTQKFWGGKVAPNAKVRWDEYSGEPTSSNAGKSAQVNPRTFSKTALSPPEHREMGYHVSVTGPETASKSVPLAERANRFGRRPSPVDTKPREPWSLAIGRTEIVKPFKDQPSDKPLKFMRKTDPAKKADQVVSNSLATTTKHHPVRPDTEPVADSFNDFYSREEPIKPIVPLKVGRNSPSNSGSPVSPQYPRDQAPYSYPSPITPTNKPTPAAAPDYYDAATRAIAEEDPRTPIAGISHKSRGGTPESTATKDIGSKSRFSWTTYNSGTTYQHSPPPSPPPPLPTSLSSEHVPATSSILDRKRPIPSSEHRVISRKPVGESTASIMQPKANSSEPSSPRPGSAFSSNPHKALPRPPPEVAAADHIETLQSQQDNLRIRRNNVYKLLTDLNNMAPPNPMITDFKRMRLVEQRKKEFARELEDIKVEEHDVGLKLHRAVRKREALDPNGGSALWVRRVTS